MFFQTPTYVHENYLKNAFSDLIQNSSKVKLITLEGTVFSFNRNLLVFYSPLVKKLLENSSEEGIIFLPECSSSSLEHLENVFMKGFTEFTAVQDIKDVSKVLGINLDNFGYVEKSVVGDNMTREHEKDMVENEAAKTDNIVIKAEPIEPMVEVKKEPCDDLINETLEELSGYFSKNMHESNSNEKCKETDTEVNAADSPTKGTKRPSTNDNEDFVKKIRGAQKKKENTISNEVKDRASIFVENENMQNVVDKSNSVKVCKSSKSSPSPPASQPSPANPLQSVTPSPKHSNLVSPTIITSPHTPHIAHPGQQEHHQQSPQQLHLQQSPQQLHLQQSPHQLHLQQSQQLQQQNQMEGHPQSSHLGYNSSLQQNEQVANHQSYPQQIQCPRFEQQQQHNYMQQGFSQQHYQGQSTPYQQPPQSTPYHQQAPQSSHYQQPPQSNPYQQPPKIQHPQLHSGQQMHFEPQQSSSQFVGDSDNFVAKVKKNGGTRWGPSPPARQPLSCYRCGKSGHFARNCWE